MASNIERIYSDMATEIAIIVAQNAAMRAKIFANDAEKSAEDAWHNQYYCPGCKSNGSHQYNGRFHRYCITDEATMELFYCPSCDNGITDPKGHLINGKKHPRCSVDFDNLDNLKKSK
jgi:hypothetical protein